LVRAANFSLGRLLARNVFNARVDSSSTRVPTEFPPLRKVTSRDVILNGN